MMAVAILKEAMLETPACLEAPSLDQVCCWERSWLHCWLGTTSELMVLS